MGQYLKTGLWLIVWGLLLIPNFCDAIRTQEDQHIEVSLRMIGHQLLLNDGDSISRVLPIHKIEEGFKIQFESEFGFVPDRLVDIVKNVMNEAHWGHGYFVEVERCGTSEIVYSFEINNLWNKDIVPCQGREQPRDCYNLLFTLIDEQASESTDGSTITDLSLSEDTRNKKIQYSLISVMGVLMLGAILFLWHRKKKTLLNPHLIALGRFMFDKKNAILLFNQQKIELTSKEADLLLLLYEAANTTVKREVILSRVWEDEGDYVGRTLDVFISKLRKKLEADPGVKIVNIRGVGYKLVIDDSFSN